jgi:hypothetical protein
MRSNSAQKAMDHRMPARATSALMEGRVHDGPHGDQPPAEQLERRQAAGPGQMPGRQHRGQRGGTAQLLEAVREDEEEAGEHAGHLEPVGRDVRGQAAAPHESDRQGRGRRHGERRRQAGQVREQPPRHQHLVGRAGEQEHQRRAEQRHAPPVGGLQMVGDGEPVRRAHLPREEDGVERREHVVRQRHHRPVGEAAAPGELADAEHAAVEGRDQGGDEGGQRERARGEHVIREPFPAARAQRQRDARGQPQRDEEQVQHGESLAWAAARPADSRQCARGRGDPPICRAVQARRGAGRYG